VSVPIKIYVMEEGMKMPDDDLCYLVGANGIFKRTRCPLFEIVIKVSEIPGLANLGTLVRPTVVKIPEPLLRQVESFFKAVYEKHKAEAVVLVLYNEKEKAWKLLIPDQEVMCGHADYDLKKVAIESGHVLFGSMHSHGSMSAFHSGTDDKDECKFDGIHITIGAVDGTTLSYAVRWSMAGMLIKADLEDVVDLPKPLKVPCEESWLDRVKTRGAAQIGYLARPAGQDFQRWREDYGEGWSEEAAAQAPASPAALPTGTVTVDPQGAVKEVSAGPFADGKALFQARDTGDSSNERKFPLAPTRRVLDPKLLAGELLGLAEEEKAYWALTDEVLEGPQGFATSEDYLTYLADWQDYLESVIVTAQDMVDYESVQYARAGAGKGG